MIVLGVASLAAVLASSLPRPEAGPDPSGILRTHWEYGRWALLTALLGWCGNLYYFVLPVWHGLESAAALRAIMNFIYPVIQVNQALALYLLPRWAAHGSRDGFARSLARLAWAWALFSLALFGGAVLFGPSVMHWVYKGRYDAVAPLLPWAFLLVLPDGIAYFIGNGLRAGRIPKRVAAAAMALPVVAVFPGCLFMYLWGPRGAVAALLLASVAQLGLSWYWWNRPDGNRVSPS
jgi:O-antigen/teichoic acid export membrane protein